MGFQLGNRYGKENKGKLGIGRPKGAKTLHSRDLGPHKVIVATTREFATACREFGPEIISRWVTIMRDNQAALDLRLKAMDRLIERGFGRVPQAHQHLGAFGTYDLDKLTDEQLRTLDGILTLALPDGVGDTD